MKKELIIAFRLCFVFCCLTATGWWSVSCKQEKDQTAASPDDEVCAVDSSAYFLDICIDSLEVNYQTIHSGDNLSSIFGRLGFSPSESDSIVRTTAGLIEPKKIHAGNPYYILTTRDEEPRIQYVIIAKTLTDHVVIDLSHPPAGAYLFQKEVTLRQRYLDGSVKSSLWAEIKKQGVDPLLAIYLSDVYAWQIDFFGIQPNDSFQVLYTESYIDTVSTGIYSIDGAIFIHEGRPFTAVPFEQDSVREFFDADGQSLRKAFLKAPLDFFRITSRFTNSRFHPVLKRYRAHHGVDYAAPSGTPVKTIGNGKVIARGFERGGGGNYLKIQHNSVYTTSYMHLSKFAKNISVGKLVQQGEVVGYVGTTGLSTGPHLDFRVYKNGQAIDPLKMESPPSHPVKPELKDSFDIVKQQMTDKLQALGARDTLTAEHVQIKITQ